MKLADKIIKLRKQFGWSQEELAEQMKVSRQSVSKWESAASIPDMNKIIRLSEIFSVATDYLLKDEIEAVSTTEEDHNLLIPKLSLQEANDYIDAKGKIASIISKAVLFFIFSVIPLFTFLAISKSGNQVITANIASALGLVSLFLMIAIGVILIIASTKYQKNFEKIEENEFELEYGAESIIREKADEFNHEFIIRVSISVSLFIFSSLPLIVSGIMGAGEQVYMSMLIVLILICGIGVYLLIPYGSRNNVYNRLLARGEFSPSLRKGTQLSEKIAGFYWPLVTAIYIGWSLITMDWGTTWIVWPVAALLFVAVVGLSNLFSRD